MTGVALITFILLGVKDPHVQVQLLVWIFVMRIMMLVASAVAYFLNGAIAKARYGNADELNFEAPLTSLVWITSIISIALTYIVSYCHHSEPGRRHHAVVEARDDHLLRNAGGRDHPRIGEGLHFHRIAACARSRDLGGGRRRVARTFCPASWPATSPPITWA